MDLKTWLRKSLAWCLVICFISSMATPAQAAQTTADLLRLETIEGTVKMTTKNDKAIEIFDGIKLHNGYKVETDLGSYAYISLDSTKVIKLDSLSKVEIRKQGKSLEVLLISGSLFFNVTAPLESDENLNIRTSTTVTGIRGTCGVIKTVIGSEWECIDSIQIWEGSTLVKAENPLNGKVVSEPVLTREFAISTVSKNPADNRYAKITKGALDEQQLPGFAAVEVGKSQELREKLAENGYNVNVIVEQAENRLMEDEAQKQGWKTELENHSSGQSHDTKPVFNQQPSGSAGGGSDSGNGSNSSTLPTSPTGSTNPTSPTTPTSPTGPTTPTSPTGSTTPTSPTGSTTAPVPSTEAEGPAVTLTMAVNAERINYYINKPGVSSVTVIPGSGSNQLNMDHDITIPTGRQLTLETGVTPRVNSGTTLQIDGTMVVRESLDNRGTINNSSMNTLNAQSGIVNAAGGVIENTGRIVLGGDLVNNGQLNNEKQIEAGSNKVINNLGTAVIEGRINGDLDNRSTMTLDGEINGSVNNSGDFTMNGGSAESLVLADGSFDLVSGTVEEGVLVEGTASFTQSNGTVIGSGSSSAINCNGGTVDVSGGSVKNESGNAIECNGGTVEITSGTITASENAIDCSSGTVGVSGGVVSGRGSSINCAGGTVTLDGGLIESEGGYVLSGTGGEIIWDSSVRLLASRPSQLLNLDSAARLTVDGVQVSLDDKCLTVSQDRGQYQLTAIKESPLQSLQQADPGDVIVLAATDLTTTGELTIVNTAISYPVILDLNGNHLILKHKMVIEQSSGLRIQNGDILIESVYSNAELWVDGTSDLQLENISADIGGRFVRSTGSLLVEDCDISLEDTSVSVFDIVGGRFILKDSTIEAMQGSNTPKPLINVWTVANRSIRLEDSSILSKDATAVNLDDGADLTITGDKTLITGSGSPAQIVIAQTAALSLEGGEICNEGDGSAIHWANQSAERVSEIFPQPEDMCTKLMSAGGKVLTDKDDVNVIPPGYRLSRQDDYLILEEDDKHGIASPGNADWDEELDSIDIIDDINKSDTEEPDPRPSDVTTPSNARLRRETSDVTRSVGNAGLEPGTMVFIRKEKWGEQE